MNGTGLFLSSLHADMALTLTKNACRTLHPEAKSIITNIDGMTSPTPFFEQCFKPENRLVQMEVNIDLALHPDKVISSTVKNSKTKTVLAKRTVDYKDASR